MRPGARGCARPDALSLRGDGTLSRQPALADPARTYAYLPVAGSQGIGNPAYGGVAGPPDVYLWSLKPPPASFLQWTSAR